MLYDLSKLRASGEPLPPASNPIDMIQYMHEIKYMITDYPGWNDRGFITIHKIGGEPFQSFKLRVIKQLQEKSKHPAKFYISSEFNSELQKAFKKGKYEEWRRTCGFN